MQTKPDNYMRGIPGLADIERRVLISDDHADSRTGISPGSGICFEGSQGRSNKRSITWRMNYPTMRPGKTLRMKSMSGRS